MPVLPVSHSIPAVEVHRTPVHRAAPSNNLLMSSTATSDFNALPMVLPRVSTLPSPTGATESSITGLVEPANLLLSSPARDAVTQPPPAVSAPPSVAPAASNIIELPGIVGTSCPPPPAPPQQLPTERREEQGQSETGSERAPVVTDVETGNVPMSHLLAGSQYPSLQHVPIGIAQSFAPIFVQPNPAPAEASDIYSDYINDPYNLTLQIDNGAPVSVPSSSVTAPEPAPQSATAQPDTLSRTLEDTKTAGPMLTGATTVTATPSAQLANVFQSAQYFSFPASGHIPPGSEMLFGEP